MSRRIQTVKGHLLPKPRLTGWGYWVIATRIALPFFGALALMDGILYLIFRYGLDRCYGIFCLFE